MHSVPKCDCAVHIERRENGRDGPRAAGRIPPPVHVHAADIIELLVAGEATHGLASDTAGRMIGSVGLPPFTPTRLRYLSRRLAGIDGKEACKQTGQLLAIPGSHMVMGNPDEVKTNWSNSVSEMAPWIHLGSAKHC